MNTWTHPQLGTFTFEDDAWTALVAVPAFEAFNLKPWYGPRREPVGHREVRFEANDPSEWPSDELVSMVLRLLAVQHDLVRAVVTALWEEFNGRGPRSGLWWRGDLASVMESRDDLPRISGPDDILAWMSFNGIRSRNDLSNRPAGLLELSFEAAFEDEHGVGMLTDGSRVLGSGYSHDVSEYKA